ncbi:MAG: T9SS type B sorting domain-containing protein [Sphingobacteriales bacterium]|nr:T9SS type B sorting domain-containing protein [Sphingobacteriales bacterium]
MRVFLFAISGILMLTFCGQNLYATHARAGEIIYKQIGKPDEYKYEITVVYYTESTSPANRDDIDIYFGDNTKENVKLETRLYLGNFTFYNTYRTVHIYPGPGTYIIQFYDPNRIDGIKNMQYSVFTPFYVETMLKIDKFKGTNRSPVLLLPPIDYAEVKKVYKHNPGAYDPDGDSLVFTFIPPKQAVGKNVDGYYLPYAKNGFTLNRYTGDIRWDYPDTIGIFNIAILIEEFRNKERIGYMIRDMQIIVEKGINNPPYIDPINDTCIEAGKTLTLQIPLAAHDPDIYQKLEMTAIGGPFAVSPPVSVLNPSPATGTKDVVATFTWTPTCQHIRKEPYSVVVKVVDDHPLIPLADLEHFFIKVVGPAPKNLTAGNTIKGIRLTWEKPDVCNNVRGYYIYRKADSSFWDTSRCETGIPDYTGFERIASINHPDSLNFFDNNNGKGLVSGMTYCYRVTAKYLAEGNFELVEGYASNEVCARQQKDLPVITHVSIDKTSESSGIVWMDWSKPTELDTNLYKGPYKNVVLKSINGNPFQAYKVFNSATFYGLKDTLVYDTLQDTRNNYFSYQIEFYGTDNGNSYLLGKSQPASSVFLEIKPSHRKNYLIWSEAVPWYNEYYVIYRKNDISLQFDSIGVSKKHEYIDTGLINGKSYCYKIKSYGYYTAGEGFVFPLLNWSQEVCAEPADSIPPCAPKLKARAVCPELRNQLDWYFEDTLCSNEIYSFKIYYSKLSEDRFELITELQNPSLRSFNDNRPELSYSLAGCYMITAVDSFGNESSFSNPVCVENCPQYELPNIFTPNGDGINDLMKPLQGSMHVAKIDLKVFNRWGQLVFQTSDPAINWDGKDMMTGIDCSPGTYYYVCTVFQLLRQGNREVVLKGTVNINR